MNIYKKRNLFNNSAFNDLQLYLKTSRITATSGSSLRLFLLGVKLVVKTICRHFATSGTRQTFQTASVPSNG